MENYRLRKSKSTYVILMFLIAITILSLYLIHMISLDIPMDNSQYSEFQVTFEGHYFGMSGNSYLLSQYENSLILFFLIIFGSIFFTAPYSNGFIKNFIGGEKKKYKYILSVFIVGAIYILFLFIVSTVITIIGLPIASNGDLVVKNIGEIIKTLSVQYLIHIAILSLVLLISTISRSTPITLLISLSYHTILINLFIFLIDTFLDTFFVLGENFSIENYSLIRLSENLNADTMNRAIIISIIAIILSLFLSSIVMKKKDF